MTPTTIGDIMRFFKPADPTRRIPVWLQAHTKENLIWQLKLLGVFILVSTAYDHMNTRRVMREFEAEKYDQDSE